MNKVEFTNDLKTFKAEIIDLRKKVQNIRNKQIHGKSVLQSIETIATKWFDRFESTIRHFYSLDTEIVDRYHTNFGKLLDYSTIKPSKTVVFLLLQKIEKEISIEIIVPILKYQSDIKKNNSFSNILSGQEGIEQEYLKEAISCVEGGCFRAAVILGWCATVDKLHKKIIKIGLDKFNHSSLQMAAISSGRYKRFNKKYDLHNLAELRMTVFDNDLLWVLEFIGLIDGNEHEKLEICFTIRNTCAHPGDSNITLENITSFFSDLNQLVFQNKKLSSN